MFDKLQQTKKLIGNNRIYNILLICLRRSAIIMGNPLVNPRGLAPPQSNAIFIIASPTYTDGSEIQIYAPFAVNFNP